MKEQFPEYFSKDRRTINKIWKSAIFVFDTNILCNMYRYPNEAREKFFQVLKGYSNRIWLPYTVVEEFLKNRPNVIHEQIDAYIKTLEEIKSLEDSLSNERKHPFLASSSMKSLTKVLEQIKDELEKSRKTHEERILDDSILLELNSFFNEKVGSQLAQGELKKVFESGRERYSERIPPGFEDRGKADEESTSNKALKRRYGDLIIWEEILRYAKSGEQDVILVTDDKKDDWWLIKKGKTLAPRPELIREFSERTEQNFLMYTMEQFLKYSTKDLDIEVEQSVFDDVRSIGKSMSAHANRKLNFAEYADNRDLKTAMAKQAMYEIRSKRNEVMSELHSVAQAISEKESKLIKTGWGKPSDDTLKAEIHALKSIAEELRAKMQKLDDEFALFGSAYRNNDYSYEEELSSYLKSYLKKHSSD